MPDHTFEAQLFAWDPDLPDSWNFVALPEDVSDEIEESVGGEPRGFGSVRVGARLGATEWTTSLFPSKAHGAYILPVKRAVRRTAGVEAGDTATFTVTVLH
jgi:hypothetical protein